MARSLALVAVLVAGCASTTDAPPGPPASTTLAPPTPHPSSTTQAPPAPPSTVPVPPAVSTTSVRTPTSAVGSPPASASTAPPPEDDPAGGAVNHGRASWYARGATTASGEHFDPDGLTAASRTLPFETRLRVCRPAGAPCVEVRVTDRGPARWTGRQLDLSRAAFAAIAPLGAGVIDVTWEAA